MPTARRARAPTCEHNSATRFRLADLGVYGFDRHETTILARLVTEDPLLLVGRSGTGKTFLLNTLSEALGLEHRHYNASLISFDDLVGFRTPTRRTRRCGSSRAGDGVGRGVGADRRDLALQARAPEPASSAGARAAAAGTAARATPLPLVGDEPVHADQGGTEDTRDRSRSTGAGRPVRASSSPRGLERPHSRAAGRDRRAVGEGKVTRPRGAHSALAGGRARFLSRRARARRRSRATSRRW